ncbi:MAG: hypothetical protein R3231_11480 [bacterium]|nr:hypothetical protein [bacterium]
MASAKKQRKAIKARKIAKLARNKSDVMTVAERRRAEKKVVVTEMEPEK